MKPKGITAYKSSSFDGIAVHDLDITILVVYISPKTNTLLCIGSE